MPHSIVVSGGADAALVDCSWRGPSHADPLADTAGPPSTQMPSVSRVHLRAEASEATRLRITQCARRAAQPSFTVSGAAFLFTDTDVHFEVSDATRCFTLDSSPADSREAAPRRFGRRATALEHPASMRQVGMLARRPAAGAAAISTHACSTAAVTVPDNDNRLDGSVRGATPSDRALPRGDTPAPPVHLPQRPSCRMEQKAGLLRDMFLHGREPGFLELRQVR